MNNTLYFVTPGMLDMRSITVFGLSAKQGENPIGYFGTGLKYAIAILLRNGAQLYIESDGMRYDFNVHDDNFRTKEYQAITMHSCLKEYDLPFTTELGQSWEMWMAFRELYCNTLDENGVIVENIPSIPDAWEQHTIVAVKHPKFYDAYMNKGQYFIENRSPVTPDGIIEPYEGESKYMFYRGIRVGELSKPSVYTWNYKYTAELTEDRTFKYHFIWESPIGGVIASSSNKEFIKNCVLAPDGTLEAHMAYGQGLNVSPEFMEVMEPLAEDFSGSVSPEARKLYEYHARKSINMNDSVPLNKIEQSMLHKSMQVCRGLGTCPDDVDIIICKSLGTGILGLSRNGKVFLSKEVFSMGTKMVAGTLWEELLHHETRMMDMTRTLQNFLINKVMSQYEEIKGEPL